MSRNKRKPDHINLPGQGELDNISVFIPKRLKPGERPIALIGEDGTRATLEVVSQGNTDWAYLRVTAEHGFWLSPGVAYRIVAND